MATAAGKTMTRKRMLDVQSQPKQTYYFHTCCGQPLRRVGKTKRGLTAYQCSGCGRAV